MRAADFSHGVTDAKLSSNGIGAANNSLSRALYCLRSSALWAWTLGAASGCVAWGGVAAVESRQLIQRQRGMRLKVMRAPLRLASLPCSSPVLSLHRWRLRWPCRPHW